MPQQRVERPVLVVRLVDQEADEPLHAGADQHAVDVRQVVADEQRRSARRHVLLAHDADAIDRVRQQPEAEADQELRHDASARRRSPASVTTPKTRMMRSARQCSRSCVNHSARGRQQDADHVEEVVGRHQPALLLVAARCWSSALSGTANRPPKKPTSARLSAASANECRAARAGREHAHADRADRREAELDLVARQASGRHAARADADRGEREQHADPAVGEAHAPPCRTGSSPTAAARPGTRSTRCR